MSRVSTARLLAIAAELDQREHRLVEELAMLGLASHAQLAALLPVSSATSAASQARTARRVLARLTDLSIFARLSRRVGGVRAGSAGYVYYLGPVGQRLVAYWQGRGLVRGRLRPEPGSRSVRHRLAVSELYVQARRAERARRLELLDFSAEPACWRPFADSFGGQAILKPDAYVRLGIGEYESRFFVEADLGSESKGVIDRKARAYLGYFNSGQEQAEHGVFPRVLFATTSERRRAALVEVCGRLPEESWQLFVITTLDKAIEVMSNA
jgi:Replication-relaxation